MQQYQHNESLKFYYPDDWEVGYGDGLIYFIANDDGVGVLQFTVFYPPESEEVSLKDWLVEQLIDVYSECLVTENGRYACSEHLHRECTSWRYWAIRKDNMVLLGTYNCDEQDQGKEDQIVDEVINSLF